ncbi:MAG: hypothetical protein QOE36_160 [Gaiellaceae bacterium]|nr:hypothetical protein [Gaiellaceae bacterium]
MNVRRSSRGPWGEIVPESSHGARRRGDSVDRRGWRRYHPTLGGGWETGAAGATGICPATWAGTDVLT